MNANELADELEACFTKADWNVLEAATMLRQQQAEIEALKLSLSGHSAEILSKNDETLPNGKYEPVAWAIKSDGDFTEIGWDDEVLYEVEEWYTAQGWQYEHIPLYTHPVKELTDEEIIDALYVADITLNNLSDGDIPMERIKSFARAILRKAQEK